MLTPERIKELSDRHLRVVGAETLGHLRVRTKTDLSDRHRRGYYVVLTGFRRSTKMEIEKEHTSLHCALADVITEAREMGLGDPG